MSLVKIGGTVLPTPTDFQVGVFDISKAERNANGNMIIERINTKRKLFITYSYITQNDAANVLTLISPTSYKVTYLDPQTKTQKTGTFYCGDRQLGVIDYYNGIPRFSDFTFNLIEL